MHHFCFHGQICLEYRYYLKATLPQKFFNAKLRILPRFFLFKNQLARKKNEIYDKEAGTANIFI